MYKRILIRDTNGVIESLTFCHKHLEQLLAEMDVKILTTMDTESTYCEYCDTDWEDLFKEL